MYWADLSAIYVSKKSDNVRSDMGFLCEAVFSV